MPRHSALMQVFDLSPILDRDDLTAIHVRELFSYNPLTGRLHWKRRISQIAKIDSKAGTFNGKGYLSVIIAGHSYQHHRLVWLWFHGSLDRSSIVDHIDRWPSNDRIWNLRIATKAQNNLNTKLRSDNRSGYRGVYFNKRLGKWCACINVAGRRKHLGVFDNPKEAAKRYLDATEIARSDDFNFLGAVCRLDRASLARSKQ